MASYPLVSVVATVGIILSLSCNGSKQARISSASQASRGGPMSSADNFSAGTGVQNSPNTLQAPAGPPGSGGQTNGSSGFEDLLGQAGDLISSIGASRNQNSPDASQDTQNMPSVRLSDFTDQVQRSELFFTLNPNGAVQSESPHGTVELFYTKNVEDFVGKKGFTAPVATVAINIFDSDSNGEPDGLAIMQKKESDYDAEGNDWYYRLVDNWSATIDGKEGKVESCKACHGETGGKDYDYLKGFQKAAGG